MRTPPAGKPALLLLPNPPGGAEAWSPDSKTDVEQEKATNRLMEPFGTFGLSISEKCGVGLARHTFLGRGRLRRNLVVPLLFSRPITRDAKIWNGQVKLRLPSGANTKYLLKDRDHDAQEREFLAAHVRPGDIIADIGSNVGFYTLWFAQLSVANTKIISVEPNPASYTALVENIELNGFRNVIVAHAAIGESDCAMELLAPKNYLGGASFFLDGASDQVRSVGVRMITLKHLLEENAMPRIDILKIDVEGYEYRALMPYLEANQAADWPRLFQIECNARSESWEGQLIEKIKDNGYRVAMETRGNVVLTRGR